MFLARRKWLSGLNRCEALTTVIALFASTRIAFLSSSHYCCVSESDSNSGWPSRRLLVLANKAITVVNASHLFNPDNHLRLTRNINLQP